MTLAEIAQELHRLRYEGKWSYRALAKECNLAPSTIKAAFEGSVSAPVQARLTAALKIISADAPTKHRPAKGKPGHFKRYLIRYYNLMKWLEVIEQEPGLPFKFKRKQYRNMSRDLAAYVCTKLDYQMKKYLLELFGEKMRQAKQTLADCYPCEKWIERIHKTLPMIRPGLFKEITKR